MSSLNRVQIIGKLGKDPEIRTMQSGKKVASFSVACGEQWKDKNTGEKKESTEWINIVIFNENLVGVAERFLKKGSQAFIEGKMQTRKWTDNNGIDRYSTEVVLQAFGGQIILLGSKQNGNRPPPNDGDERPADNTTARTTFDDDLDDEIPF